MTTTEENILIAEFMGYKLTPCNNGLAWDIGKSIPSHEHLFPIQGVLHTGNELNFYTSWDWLMPVVDKIESIELKDSNSTNYYDVCIMPDAVLIGLQSDDLENPLILINKSEGVGSINHHVHLFEKKRDAVYNAVVEFINFYNKK